MMKDEWIVSCWYRKSFKSVHGLRVSLTRKGCHRTHSDVPDPSLAMQHSGAILPSGNASDESSRLHNHSTADESTAGKPGPRCPPRNWPIMSDSNTQSAMDDDLSVVLQLRLKLRYLAHTVCSYSSEMFGTIEKKCRPARGNLSRRQQEIGSH